MPKKSDVDMDDLRRALSERDKRRADFYQKLQKDAPRLWRQPTDGLQWWSRPETPEAWNDLIYQLSLDIEKVFSSIEEVLPPKDFPFVQQCKEKFGQLRFYISPYPEAIADELDRLITDAEVESTSICCKCSTKETTKIRSRFPEPHSQHIFGWICPYCDECYMKEALERAKKCPVKELRNWYQETMIERKKQDRE